MFKPVTSLANINQKYLDYAYARTAVPLPNCFTYATARVSQTVGRNQSLDGNSRVVGAGQLWETHASEFIQSSVAQPGALAIFKGRIYGHVACVEVVGHRMMITESNLGDYGAGYFRCVEMDKTVGSTHPCDYAMRLVGFLIHKDLIPKPEPVKPKKIGYLTHIQNKGWTNVSYDGEVSGTEGQSLRCEAFKVFTVDGTIVEEVQVHLQDFGWRTYKYPGAETVLGTTGQHRRLEAIKMKTSKPCQIRAHLQDIGWTKWVNCDGKSMVGTEGQSRRLEAIQIKRVDEEKKTNQVGDKTIVTADEGKKLGLAVETQLIPQSKYDVKSPYSMTPTRVVVHNSGTPNANAQALANNIVNTNDTRSWHFSVDETKAIQSIPMNRNSFNAGDGANGVGNRQGISIEIARDMEGNTARADKAQDNGAKLVAILLKKFGWDISKVTKHQDYNGKYCPHRILDNGWNKFLDQVKTHLKKL